MGSCAMPLSIVNLSLLESLLTSASTHFIHRTHCTQMSRPSMENSRLARSVDPEHLPLGSAIVPDLPLGTLPFGLPSLPEVKDSVGMSSGPTTKHGNWSARSICGVKMSSPCRWPPCKSPLSCSASAGISVLSLRLSKIYDRTCGVSSPASWDAFTIMINAFGLATSRYNIWRSDGYLVYISCQSSNGSRL